MTTRPWRPLVAAAFLVFGASACSGDDTTDSAGTDSATTGGDVAYADVQAIWDLTCSGSGCHTDSGDKGGLVLDEGVSYANLVGVPSVGSPLNLVTASDTDNSYLWHKLQDTHEEAGGSGSSMPLGTDLDLDQLSTVERWINQGALAD